MGENTPDSGAKQAGGAPSVGSAPLSPREDQARLIQQFVRDYSRQLLEIATRLVGRTHAEDVAQDAFVKLAQRLAQRPLPEVMALLRSSTDLRKLMCRITAGRAYDHLRRRDNRISALSDDAAVDSIEASAPQRLEAMLDVERVERAYASLTPTQRIAHVLHHYYGFTDTDFQLTLGISKTNSRTLVRRANRALRRALEMKS